MTLTDPHSDNQAIEYALQTCKYLLTLYIGWEKSLQSLNSGEENLPEWGPSNAELADARHAVLSACIESDTEEVESGDLANDVDDDLGFEEGEDAGLADALV